MMADYCKLSICVDCLMYHENGEPPEDLSEEDTAAWVAEVSRRLDGGTLSLGHPREAGDRFDCQTCGGSAEYGPDYVAGSGTAGWWDKAVPAYHVDTYGDPMPDQDADHPPIDDPGERDDSLGFSWSRCDSCGSHLGGDREAATLCLMRHLDDRRAAGVQS